MAQDSTTTSFRSLKERVLRFGTDIVYDRRSGGNAGKVLAVVLRWLSRVFEQIVLLRFFLYTKRVFRNTPLGCKVIVVGNLTVGGTGKTPVVEKIARVLAERGRKVAVLSRGYKSKKEPLWTRFVRTITHAKRRPPRVVSDGKQVLLDAATAGDEPYMLAKNLAPLGVCVVVDRDRVYAGSYAIKNFGADIIILDDGMQYLPLRGSLNLLLVDKTNPFGNGCLLPRGILREPVKHLKRGDFIFLTKSDGSPESELLATIREYNKDAEIVECKHEPKRLCSVSGDADLELSALSGKRVATFSGIATPEKFEEFVRHYGAQIAYNRRFLDHHGFSWEDLEEVFDGAEAAKASLIITTEKDMVRLPRHIKSPVPLYYLRLEIEILSDRETFANVVDRIVGGRT